MKTAYFIPILLLTFSCAKVDIEPTKDLPCQKADAYPAHVKASAYQQVLDKYVRLGMPGISVLAVDDQGTWVGAAGYADIEEDVLMNPCIVSKAASITKLTVATLAFMLQDQGKLDLDDPVANYIDADILDRIEHAEGITVRMLMNHTTGIFDLITSNDFYLAVINDPNKQWEQEELLEFVYGQPGVTITPNEASYSNTNTTLLSMVVEKVTGRAHEDLLAEWIFDPLGMDDTYLQGREALPEHTAQGYFDLHNNGTIANVSNFITGSGNGYGGLFSNVFDLERFLDALFIDKTLISEEALDEMRVFKFMRESFYLGVGCIRKWEMKRSYGIGHTGRDLGYSADLFYFPETGHKLIFYVNYGTNGKSALKSVFEDFEDELVNLLLVQK